MIQPRDHECLQSLMRAALDRHRERLCLIEANRDRENARLTYGDVADHAVAMAAALEDAGATRVAIVMSNQSRWHIAAIATFWIGAVLVPLDAKLTPEELGALLAHAGADVLVTEPHLAARIPFDGRVFVPERDEYEGSAEFVARSRGDDACIVYSSGTGGRPKGCVLSHGAYLAQLDALLAAHAFGPGDRYLSILPTNHAIDFMVGFVGPYCCGATVVHLRTLRPEFVKDAFTRYGIAHMALVPMVLGNLANGLRERLASPVARSLVAVNRAVCRTRPRLAWSRIWLRPVHRAFGGKLRTLFCGGAFTDPDLLRFFQSLGIPVVNGYGLTEACTVVTLNDFESYRPDTVGRPVAGAELRILEPGADGIGEVLVRGPTLMTRYLDDEELTRDTLRGGWLHTGDLGRVDDTGHLTLYGRRKNMIVTAGGKNVYPEDIENVFAGLPVHEYCVFAAHYLWERPDERLVVVVRPDGRDFTAELARRNRSLPDYKRVAGYLVCEQAFARTTSMKVKRADLADAVRASGGSVVAL
ncbi:MAG: AMP-binding protein [Planctomycetota bacterium]|nr:AMP-binding protein [Planctomycetota bacterium]